jgi:hypothetical protein
MFRFRSFTPNTHIEKRFHALGFYWAILCRFNNVMGRKNWIDVNNDINSPTFSPTAYATAEPSAPHPLSWPQVN